MERLNGLIALLGEENEKKLKERIVDLIVDCISEDLKSYDDYNYILNPEDIIEFVNECKKEAFEKIKEEVVKNMVEKIKATLN